MIPEFGYFSLILALCFSFLQGIYPVGVTHVPGKIFNRMNTTAAIAQLGFLSAAMGCLILSFLMNDMSVVYVQEHSHALLPLLYRVGAAWGGHEGSLLLWCLVLSGWTVSFMLFSHLPQSLYLKIIRILGFISTGFILFLLTTSNPFLRDFPNEPITGNDLTPILQDPGLIFHPPMLYLGYVGFAIAFAFAIAILSEGKFDKQWAKACQPWVILPWSFLGCGIVLGSWWAYRELGWGGWWFWDPVENASLLPWLSATALLHSLLVTQKRGAFKGWVILLAIITFALSLLGTFLVRSGVLVSVHAFANDPSRGLFLLCYLALIIGGACLYYGYRIKHFYHPPQFQLISRETFLLINSIILVSAVATIVLGTLYPIVLDAFNLDKISVGEPYFNLVFIPLVLPLLFLMGFAPHVNWGQHTLKKLMKKIHLTLLASFLLGFFGPTLLGFDFQWAASLGISFALWIILGTLHAWVRNQYSLTSQSLSMIIAHIGIAILALGITINKSYSEERQVKMSVGESVTLADYHFTLTQLITTHGANYQSIAAIFKIQKNNTTNSLIAEQRVYPYQQTLAKPGIQVNPWRDLYVALGQPLNDHSWSVRLYYKPFVRWIWAGGFLLLLGGLISILHGFKNND